MADAQRPAIVFTTHDLPRERLYVFYVAMFHGRPELSAPYCSRACAIARYAEAPDGFVRQTRTLPGYVRVECGGCGAEISERQA